MASTLEAARAIAFRYLGYSARSRAEIERRLRKDSFPPDIVEAVIAECTSLGWIDDRKFAHDWVADRADRKGYGQARLAVELERRGIDKEWITEALSAIDEEAEIQRALAEAVRKWRPGLPSDIDCTSRQAEERRLAGFLLRRGFSRRIIVQVLRHLVENTA